MCVCVNLSAYPNVSFIFLFMSECEKVCISLCVCVCGEGGASARPGAEIDSLAKERK